MKKIFFILFLSANALYASQNKGAMLQDLSTIKGIFETGYASMDWKKENDHWSLDYEYHKAADHISKGNDLSLKEYQQQLRKFMNSSMDYHVSIIFYSTELATLPFRVKTVDDHTYVDWINPVKLSKQKNGLRQGDEILQFDGRPVAEVLAELTDGRSKHSNPLTDIAVTDENLTQRIGAKGDVVPKGTLNIVFRSKEDEKIKTNQMVWEYHPELIKTPSNLMQTIPFLNEIGKSQQKQLKGKYSLCNELYTLYSARGEDDGSLGSRISFVPILGNPVWVWEGNLEGEEPIESYSNYPMWNAYIYENGDGRKIGYIRIPHYEGSEEDALLFGKVIGYMEQNTEALVIDQVNNYGGSVNFTYSLASMLATEPLKTPKHRIKLTQEDVYQALGAVEVIDMLLGDAGSINEILRSFGYNDDSIDYQQLLFLKYFYQFLSDEWNEGRDFTLPTYIDGSDLINPNPVYHYSKPIVFLINELDFSGGDFMPAILQDNNRAVIFGRRTAGAGGFLKSASFPNKHGIRGLYFTASLAERESSKKIESLGITPDIKYKITKEDVQDGYINYGIKVNEVVSSLLPPKAEVEQLEQPEKITMDQILLELSKLLE